MPVNYAFAKQTEFELDSLLNFLLLSVVGEILLSFTHPWLQVGMNLVP